LICCPQKWLSLLEAEDTETSEDKELLAHRAQEMAFRSRASPLAQGLAKTTFLPSWTSKSGNYMTALTGYTAHPSQ